MKQDAQSTQEHLGRPEGPEQQPQPPAAPSSSDPAAELKPRLWIFGYGSLVWRPGFEFTSRKVGFIRGYSRRFWQGDTFHRGSERAVSAGRDMGHRGTARRSAAGHNAVSLLSPHSPAGW